MGLAGLVSDSSWHWARPRPSVLPQGQANWGTWGRPCSDRTPELTPGARLSGLRSPSPPNWPLIVGRHLPSTDVLS